MRLEKGGAYNNFCYNCGEKTNPNADFCLSCGVCLKNGGAYSDTQNKKFSDGFFGIFPKSDYNILSIIGLIVGAASVFLRLSIPAGLAAIIISSLSLNQIGKSGERGRPLAITGICLGSFSVIIGLLLIFGFLINIYNEIVLNVSDII